MPKIHYTRFLIMFSVDGEVANLLATSRCNGIWEMTRYNRHNGLLPAPTCCGETRIIYFPYTKSAVVIYLCL